MFIFLLDKSDKKNKEKVISKESSSTGGYLLIKSLADKYGYTKDHLGWLARSGRIEAVRYGKKGQWYAKEEDVKNYQEFQEKRFSYVSNLPNRKEETKVSTISVRAHERDLPVLLYAKEDSRLENLVDQYNKNDVYGHSRLEFSSDKQVLFDGQVLSNGESSLSTNNDRRILVKRINAVLVSSLILTGVLIFFYLSPSQINLVGRFFQ